MSLLEVLLLVEDDWSLLVPLVLPVVPAAPMLDVLGLVELLAVPPEVLGLVLGLAVLLAELLGVLLVEPIELLVPGVLLVDEALVPPPPLVPAPPVCATAKPPMASAAAAANVVSVFLVVVMSFAP